MIVLTTICVNMAGQVSAWFATAFNRLYDNGYIKSVEDILIMLLSNVGSYCYWGGLNTYTAIFSGSMYGRYFCLADIFDYISGFKYDREMSKLYLDFNIDAARANGFTGYITAHEATEEYRNVCDTLACFEHGDDKISHNIDKYNSAQLYHELTNIALSIKDLFFRDLKLISESCEDQCVESNVNALF